MSTYIPQNPKFRETVQRTFDGQKFLTTLGAALNDVDPGYVEISLSRDRGLTQHQGFFHGGVMATLADVAGGFAALSLMAAEQQVVTVEFKINFLSPATAEGLLARGEVMRAGKSLTICQSDIYGVDAEGSEALLASALGTFLAVTQQQTRFLLN